MQKNKAIETQCYAKHSRVQAFQDPLDATGFALVPLVYRILNITFPCKFPTSLANWHLLIPSVPGWLGFNNLSCAIISMG